jgi:tight adherence protein B
MTLTLLKFLALLLFFGAVAMFVRSLHYELSTWWNGRIDKYSRWMADEFESMFETMTPERARQLITILVAGGFVAGFFLASGLAGRFFWGFAFAAAGYFIPRGLVLYLRRKRMATIDDQLVDALHLMSNGLKAGLSLQQSLELVVREMKPPIADEFGRLMKEIHLGRLMDDALRRFIDRVPLEDLRLAVDSVLTLRETGGDLSETFEVVAKTIVERKKVEGKIKAMTAQGMTQGVLMCMMPLFMMLMFTFISPDYMAPLFNSVLGWVALVFILLLDLTGLFLMFKLVKVEV